MSCDAGWTRRLSTGEPFSSPGRRRNAAAPAAAGGSSFQNRLRNIVNQASGGGSEDIKILGQTQIIADERTNSLLIFANKAGQAGGKFDGRHTLREIVGCPATPVEK